MLCYIHTLFQNKKLVFFAECSWPFFFSMYAVALALWALYAVCAQFFSVKLSIRPNSASLESRATHIHTLYHNLIYRFGFDHWYWCFDYIMSFCGLEPYNGITKKEWHPLIQSHILMSSLTCVKPTNMQCWKCVGLPRQSLLELRGTYIQIFFLPSSLKYLWLEFITSTPYGQQEKCISYRLPWACRSLFASLPESLVSGKTAIAFLFTLLFCTSDPSASWNLT